jgi:hypothetical protein
MTYAVILQYPKDRKLKENRVTFFDTLGEAKSWRDAQGEDWLKVFRVAPVGDDMYEKAYFEISKALDEALGTEEEDGAGQGIVADVMLLAHRYQLALDVLAQVPNLGTVVQEIRSAQLPDPFEGMAS